MATNTEDTLFYYINDLSIREMLTNAYLAIQLTEMWPFMKKDIESYMFGSNPEIKIIYNKMLELGYNDHSGNTFGWTMRQMQFIAKNGLEAYKNK